MKKKTAFEYGLEEMGETRSIVKEKESIWEIRKENGLVLHTQKNVWGIEKKTKEIAEKNPMQKILVFENNIPITWEKIFI